MNTVPVPDIPHLDPVMIAQLPSVPGVYIFRGETALPLYIGKSIDIRTRVLSHIRGEEKSRMIAQARSVDYIETAGDIGAQLLESRLIKEHKPLYNIRLRRVKMLYSIRLAQKTRYLLPQIVSSQEVIIGHTDSLYGLFRSVGAVRSKLEELAVTHHLCHGLLGLEKIAHRGCFRLQIKKCLGACVGQEDVKQHDDRLVAGLNDLKIHIWPYEGPVELIEQRDSWVQRHRIDQWRYLGTWCSRDNQFMAAPEQGFDLDTYKILVRPIMFNPDENVIQPLSSV